MLMRSIWGDGVMGVAGGGLNLPMERGEKPSFSFLDVTLYF